MFLRAALFVLASTHAHLITQGVIPSPKTPDQAISALKQGNVDSLKPDNVQPIATKEERVRNSKGQSPFAVIVTCSDSRIPPEIVFDRRAGELFVVRLAGNVADQSAVGSTEYGVEHLHAKLVLVLGHSACGAISASLMPAADRAKLPANIQHILDHVETGGHTDAHGATIANVRHQMRVLAADPVLDHEVKTGHLKIVGGFYDIATGKVIFL